MGACQHYLFYNSSNAESHLENMVARMVDIDRRNNPTALKKDYGGDDLYKFFISTPIPQEAVREITRKGDTCAHSYVNALRFEYLRQVYAVVFAGVSVTPRSILRELPPR